MLSVVGVTFIPEGATLGLGDAPGHVIGEAILEYWAYG